jgi:hypothetical protein
MRMGMYPVSNVWIVVIGSICHVDNNKRYRRDKYPVQQLLIVNKMTNNSYFPNPEPNLATIQTAITVYADALVKCLDGTKQDTATKNAYRLNLEDLLGSLGNYVNLIAQGDLIKLDSSGFIISKIPEPVGILDAPPSFNVLLGNNSGEVTIEIGVVDRASGYIVLYSELPAPADNEHWNSKLFSKSKGLLTNLKAESKYAFKAAATSSEANRIGLYNFSNTIEKLVP